MDRRSRWPSNNNHARGAVFSIYDELPCNGEVGEGL
jgi:hypothetical protein